MIRYEGDPAQLVSSVEKLWKQQSANEPFEYVFLDENFDKLFRAEQRMGDIFSIFSGSCDIYCVPGFVRACRFYVRATNQGNWYSEGTRRLGIWTYRPPVEGSLRSSSLLPLFQRRSADGIFQIIGLESFAYRITCKSLGTDY